MGNPTHSLKEKMLGKPNIRSKEMNRPSLLHFPPLEIVIEPDDIGFHAYCPALKGVHTCGDTEEEALRNVKDAAIAYLESSIKHHDPIPVGIVMRKDIGDIPEIPKFPIFKVMFPYRHVYGEINWG